MRWCKTYLVVGLIVVPSFLPAIDVSIHDVDFAQEFPAPWFTGPIIAPSGYVIKPGHYNIQPYFYYSVLNGFYNKNWKVVSYDTMTSNLLSLPFKIGLVQDWELGITPAVVAQYRNNQHSVHLSDWGMGIGYQLLNAQVGDPWPALKLNFKVTIPLGKYQHLNPEKLATDATGDGAWWGSLGLYSTKLWHIYKGHYLELRAALNYAAALPIAVHGYNTYGGSARTHARIYNGSVSLVDLAFQYNLSQNWALACDLLYKHKNKTHYNGFVGTSPLGKLLSLKSPSSENFSLAPALEYNFTNQVGLIAGVHLSLLGRNSVQFRTGVLSLNIYH